MPNRFASVTMAIILGSASSAALAQSASPPDPKLIEKQARTFVSNYAAVGSPQIKQIARWHDPVCVQVSGVTADLAAKVKARIASVAQAQGLPAARDGCRPVVDIMFSDDPQSIMDDIAQHNEPLLGYYHREKMKQLKTITQPIQAWYVTATRTDAGNIDAMGRDQSSTPSGLFAGNPTQGFSGTAETRVQALSGMVDDPGGASPNGCLGQLGGCYTSVFYHVLIMADSRALVGKDQNVVVDDIVMLTLSQPQSQDGCNVLPSVMDAFAKTPCPGRSPPTGLTAADSAYLTALYASTAKGASKTTEMGEMSSRMAKILIKGGTLAVASPSAAQQR